MDEKQIANLINNLDDDYFCQELDGMIEELALDIDVNSIKEKSRHKFKKEQIRMKSNKRKFLPFIAASLVIAAGVTTVYATEISSFVQSLMGKTGVYATVVDGSSYFLKTPLELGAEQTLEKAMFTEKNLELNLHINTNNEPDVKIVIGGEEIAPHGFEIVDGGVNLFWYDITPEKSFDLIINGSKYSVELSDSNPVTDGGVIVEAVSNSNLASMGYKKIDGGIQILTTFGDSDLVLESLLIPKGDKVTETFTQSSGDSDREEFIPLVGYDAQGKSYEYQYDKTDMGRPYTKFTSSAPEGKEITLKVPGIVAGYEKSFGDINVALPAVGEKKTVNEEIDLTLQKMALESVERTSATTARLTFKLNTGDNGDVKIWNARISGDSINNSELLWENGICTMDITISESTEQVNLEISDPSFIVTGNWDMIIK